MNALTLNSASVVIINHAGMRRNEGREGGVSNEGSKEERNGREDDE